VTAALESAAGELAPFTVVVPAYDEEAGIGPTLDRLREALADLPVATEILVVDDGSRDGTASKLASIAGIRTVTHARNRGYGAALKTGLRHARHDLVVISDADGSYPCERIPDLVRRAASADMVVGARSSASAGSSTLRGIPKWFLRRFAEWLVQCEIPDLNSGLRVFRKSVVDGFVRLLPDTFSFTTTVTLAMISNGYTVVFEPIDYRPRVGRSKIKPIRDTLRFVQLILRTGMYFAPLRVFLPVAAVFAAGFAVSLYLDLFVRRDLTEATLVLLVTATQLAMFALLADMIDKRSR
jgi:glycosyltransferase involved in cell wall biosynthesis